jgi:site-specific recombinase XerD
VFWLRRYLKALSAMDPALSSDKKVEAFLTQLARSGVSASSQNQAFNALLYFYKEILEKPFGRINALRAKAPVHERHAPTIAETQALLQTVRNEGGYPTNLICRMLYGCGLRVTEPLNLRIKDIDLERRTLCIRGAKGGNDRVVVLPASLVTELRQQMEVARAVWQRDKQDGMPVMMPNRLAKKYPEFQFNWGWAWLFPAHHVCHDPRTGNIVRFRMHEVNVQRAVKHARRKLSISVLPHELRHAYATDCLQRGTNPRAIQKSMGHKYLETTMRYFHGEALSVSSPLDALPILLPGLKAQPLVVQRPLQRRSNSLGDTQGLARVPADAARFHNPSTVSMPRSARIHNQAATPGKPAPQPNVFARRLGQPGTGPSLRSDGVGRAGTDANGNTPARPFERAAPSKSLLHITENRQRSNLAGAKMAPSQLKPWRGYPTSDGCTALLPHPAFRPRRQPDSAIEVLSTTPARTPSAASAQR